jgi:hypothetical protein
MRYNISIDFDCDEDSYTDHIADSIHGMLAVLPYMVDNVDTSHYVYEESEVA